MRAQTFYRALLLLYPAAFRNEYGDEMRRMFAQQLGRTRQTGRWLGQAALWAEAAFDAMTIGPKEHCHVIFQDIRYALRSTAAMPGYATIAILSLALGIGANSAIFSIWNSVLYASLPKVNNPEELVILSNPGTSGMWHGSVRGDRDWLTYAEFEQLRDRAASFSGLMASQSGLASWQVRLPGGAWEEAHERLVSGTYFQVMGVGAVVGRLFSSDDDRAALPHAVIRYDYWQRRFSGSTAVLGTTLTVGPLAGRNLRSNGASTATLTIIGVATRGFVGETAGQQPDVWIPLRMQPAIVPSVDWLTEKPPEKIMWLHVFGRLKPGVTLARADAEANTIFKTGLESFYGSVASAQRRRELLDQRLNLRPGCRGASELRADFSTSLTALLAAVGLLLLIACANLANLQLARGAARKPEIALRLSLGASRARMVRQLVTESLVLALLGALASLAVAYSLHGVLVRMIIQQENNFRMSFALDPTILSFTLAVTLAAALIFGLLPAWESTRTDLGTSLKEHSRSATGGIRGMRLNRSLVSLQVALSLPLLVSAGLLTRTLYNLQHADLGYPTGHLLVARIDLHDERTYGTEHRSRLLAELLGLFQGVPGVRAVSFSGLGLFSGGESTSAIEVEGYAPKTSEDRESNLDRIGPGYFSALGIPITLGREILPQDRISGPKVAVINQAFAWRFFAGRNPIGMQITSLGLGREQTSYQVVGVAQNSHTQNLRLEVTPRYLIAQEQDLSSVDMPTILIRTAGETAPVLPAVRQVFRRAEPTLPLVSVESLEEKLAPLTAQDRTTAQLALVFGCVALALAAIGLYGVLSYGITRRRNEIAVRIALGAHPHRVVSMILRETSGLVITGLAIGTGLAYAASHWIHSRLYGITAQDPLTLALAVLLLVLVAFSAAYGPARGASKLDPTEALRRE
jgi:predicted permease